MCNLSPNNRKVIKSGRKRGIDIANVIGTLKNTSKQNTQESIMLSHEVMVLYNGEEGTITMKG